jgi:hypothetical protein
VADDEPRYEPLVSQTRWPDPEEGPFLLALYCGRVAGQLELCGIELRSVPRPDHWGGEPLASELQVTPKRAMLPATRLTTTILRQLNLNEIAEATKASQRQFHAWWALREPARREELLRRAEQWEVARGSRTGRKPRPRDWWAGAALAYEQATGAQRIKAVERYLDEQRSGPSPADPTNSYRAALRTVKGLRDRGMLPKKGAS